LPAGSREVRKAMLPISVASLMVSASSRRRCASALAMGRSEMPPPCDGSPRSAYHAIAREMSLTGMDTVPIRFRRGFSVGGMEPPADAIGDLGTSAMTRFL
jgi:hypothetical protein